MAEIIGYGDAIDMRLPDDWGLATLKDLYSFLDEFTPIEVTGGKSARLDNQIDFLQLIYKDSLTNDANYLYFTLSGFNSSNNFSFLGIKVIRGSTNAKNIDLVYQGSFTFDSQKTSNGFLTSDAFKSINGVVNSETLDSAFHSSIWISGINEVLIDPTGATTLDSEMLNGPDSITGSIHGDYLMGYAGNDTIRGGGNSDFIDGGDGTDTSLYGTLRENITITKSGSTITLIQNFDRFDIGIDKPETLVNVERLKFIDGTLAFDVGQWETAGEAYRLYRAAFTRTPDNSGLKYWIEQLDNGQTDIQVAHNFIASSEFQVLYGKNPTHAQLVTAMYQNTLNRAPDQGGFDYWKGLLDNKQITSEQLLINFSESAENVAAVGVSINSGIWLA